MSAHHPLSRLRPVRAALLAAALLLWTGCGEMADRSPTGVDDPGSTLQQVDQGPFQDLSTTRAVTRERTPGLMAIPGVVGTAVGLNPDGRPVMRVFLAHEGVQGVPDRLDGVPVSRVVTGQFVALADRTGSARPAPIGFSVGHPDITAGTLGARVTNGSQVFILSNNHVIAASNGANLGDGILQPGAVDGGNAPGDVIGTLHDYEPILFGDGGPNAPTNLIDAGIALVDPADVSGATPTDEGYGAPGTTVVPPSLGMAVQKYGRTTGHTFGTVSEIDLTVNVCYAGFIFCTSIGKFVDQIGITDGTFSAGGDSGSLIVTIGNGNNPVGLLFAGSTNRTIANPIGPVLQRFGVTIDPTVPGGGDPPAPDPLAASFTFDCTALSCDFDASGSTGSIVDYDWDFGDGTLGSGISPSHTYAAGGSYDVTLTVTDTEAATDEQTQGVSVSEPPVGGGSAPAVDGFSAVTRSNGPWDRADVSWSVSDADGDLAQVTVSLATSGGQVLDAITTIVSGSGASGTTALKTRNGNPARIVIMVSDAIGNFTVQEMAYN
ncbi:MAG TPA: PKD domain-containing protein [Longimicrobiales bacterium]|nr:PKD domain-containing protein [Longimicrobiales bacterium]